jgi:hypothetical protein
MWRPAYRALLQDWFAGRPVPGIELRKPNEGEHDFPFTYAQLSRFKPSTQARLRGSKGKAAAFAVTPHMTRTTSRLLYAQKFVLDDTRIDIVGLDPIRGTPVELKGYFMLDLVTRRVVGFVIVEQSVQARHVEALVGRVLRTTGICAKGCEILFEQGTVACSRGKQLQIEGMFPGLLKVRRTGMDGGKNHPGAFTQDNSGHWAGKAWVEVFMKTLGMFVSHVNGQRGGDYRRQPAMLGLRGMNRATGLLEYNRGGQIHDAALLALADRTLSFIDGDLENRIAAVESGMAGDIDRAGGRLRVETLLTVSRIIDAVKDFVTYYNNRTNHRLEGFDYIEYLDAENRPRRRKESPNERAKYLLDQCSTVRISASDAVVLMMHARPVTVRNKQGVDITILKGRGALRFWKEGSVACREAAMNADGEKKFVAIYDPDAFAHCTPDNVHDLSIHLIRPEDEQNFRSGKPVRYIESLPLAAVPDDFNPEEKAAELEKLKRMERADAAEVVAAAGPETVRRLRTVKENLGKLRGGYAVGDGSGLETLAESAIAAEIRENRKTGRGGAAIAPEISAQDELAAKLAVRRKSRERESSEESTNP